MKYTDIGIVAVFYVICALFFAETQKLPTESQMYPKVIVIILFGLTTLYLIQMIMNAVKYGTESGKEDFKGFQAKQFFVCLVLSLLYILAVINIGFYVSTAVFLVASLYFLKVKPLYIAIATVALLLLIYGAFTLFLRVQLPSNLLF
jgi:hypothetical protein